jgi:hypothetical protein
MVLSLIYDVYGMMGFYIKYNNIIIIIIPFSIVSPFMIHTGYTIWLFNIAMEKDL